MPRKNFYISEADEKEVYQKAKDLAGDSISSVIVDALKQYIYSKEMIAKDMHPIIKFDGKIEYSVDVSTGTKYRFTGKELSKHISEIDHYTIVYEFYYTLKGKFLVWTSELDKSTGTEICKISKAFDSFREVSEKGFPIQLISEAANKMPEVVTEDLDV